MWSCFEFLLGIALAPQLQTVLVAAASSLPLTSQGWGGEWGVGVCVCK